MQRRAPRKLLYKERCKKLTDYKKNDLIDECLERFYKTFELTLDTADYVPEKYNDKILAYIFKCMKKQFKKIDRTCRQIQREQKRANKAAIAKRRKRQCNNK